MKIIMSCLIAIMLASIFFVSAEVFGDKQFRSSQCKSLCISGYVKSIVDGDTLYVKEIVNGNVTIHKVRLSLTDTPEKNQTGYKKATYFTKNLCLRGSPVLVDQDDKQPFDQFNRTVGKVFCSGKILNAELLSSGNAKIAKKYCTTSEFATENWAIADCRKMLK